MTSNRSAVQRSLRNESRTLAGRELCRVVSRGISRDGGRPVRRLLIGFDGSEASISALRYGASWARKNQASLVLVSVVSKPTAVVVAWPVAVAVPPAGDHEQIAVDRLRAAVDGLATDIALVTMVCTGR